MQCRHDTGGAGLFDLFESNGIGRAEPPPGLLECHESQPRSVEVHGGIVDRAIEHDEFVFPQI